METGRSDFANKKSLSTALFYEFLGSAIVTYAFTLSSEYHLARSIAYFACFILALDISGAHFNPATTLAVFITEKKYENHLKYMLSCMLVQLCGSYLGILIVYILAKDLSKNLYPVNEGNGLYYYN